MPKRVEYFGLAAQMPPDELPTVRDVIRQAKYYQETLPGKSLGLSSNEIGMNKDLLLKWLVTTNLSVEPVMIEILKRWTEASEYFSPSRLISSKNLKDRVEYHLNMASKYEKGGGKGNVRQKYVKDSSSLFNILACKCKIQKCGLYSCEKTGSIPEPKCGPFEKFHYECTCGPDQSVPAHLVQFIW